MASAKPQPDPVTIGRRLSRGLENVFSVYVLVIFVVLWLYIAAAALTDGRLLADTWAWLGGLDTIATIVAWVAILPIAAWVWAWQAGLEPLLMGLVLLGMVAWTLAAFGGSLRAIRRARPRR